MRSIGHKRRAARKPRRARAPAQQVLEAQELERSRIARELHDQIGPLLSLVRQNLGTIQRAVPNGDNGTLVRQGIDYLERAIERVRTLSFDLRPALVEELGLSPAIASYARRQAKRAGIGVRLAVGSVQRRLPKDVETAAFRIVQEAVTNVTRHARARRFEITLGEADGMLEIEVKDDGTGFDMGALPPPRPTGGGLGLRGMRERAEAVGGHLTIASGAREGTVVSARLPIRD